MKYVFAVSDGSRWWVKVEGPLAVAAETTSPSKDLLTQHPHAADIVINYRTCAKVDNDSIVIHVLMTIMIYCLCSLHACVSHWLVLSAA